MVGVEFGGSLGVGVGGGVVGGVEGWGVWSLRACAGGGGGLVGWKEVLKGAK